MDLTKSDRVFLFQIATDLLDRHHLKGKRARWSGESYRKSAVQRLGRLAEFDSESSFHDGMEEYGYVKLTKAGWRKIAAESSRRAR